MGRVVIGEHALRIAVWMVVGLVVLGLGFGVTALLIKTAPKAEKVPPEIVVPSVEVEMVEVADYPVLIAAQGEVRPMLRTQIAAEVGGKIIEVSPKFESGEVFEMLPATDNEEKGEVLLKIDPADYRAAQANALANLENARLALQLEIANGERARRDWEKLGRGEASELVLRKPQLTSARAAVASAEAAEAKAARDLDRTVVRVPYRCRIERTYVDLGATVAPGTPLADVMSMGEVEVRLPLSLEDYGYLQRDESGEVRGEVRVRSRVGGEIRTWQGQLVRSEEFVERTTRTVNVVASFGSAEQAAPTVGLFVDASVEGRILEDVVILPRLAMSGPDKVMIVTDENEIEFRTVRVIRTGARTVIVGSGFDPVTKVGLKAGERVCVTPLNAPVNGMAVKISEESNQEGGL